MKRWIRRTTLASVLLLLAGAGPQESSEPAAPETQPSPAATASCVLRVRYCQQDLPMNRESFQELLRSTGVLGAAAREVPGLTPEILADQVEADLGELSQLQQVEGHTPVTTAILRLAVRVEPSVPEADAKAGKLVAALSGRLEQVLVERNEDALRRRREALGRTGEEVSKAEQQLAQVQQLQQKLYAEAGQTDLSPDSVVADLRALEHDGQDAEMKLVGLHARQDAQAEQIARIGKEIAARTQDDPVAVELQKVVALREKALDKVREQQKAAVASDQDVADAEERLALARAELAKQRQAASQAAGGNLLADLNKEFTSLAVDIAEAEARKKYLSDRIAQAHQRNLLALADRYEAEVAPQLKSAEQSLRDALNRRSEAEELLARLCPASVTVLGNAGQE